MRRSTNTSAETSQSLPAAQTLLARFKTPFTPTKRNLTEYYIRSDEPYRQYSPGDTVKGAVLFTVIRPFRITHLVICLHGFVKVFNHARVAGEGSPYEGNHFSTVGGPGKRGSKYHGNGFLSLFDNEVALCGEGHLDIGTYEFRFELDLPLAGLPTSIEFERGTISYLLTSTLTRPTAISPTSRRDRKLSLLETVDIARTPKPGIRVISLEPVSKVSKGKFSSQKIVIPSRTAKSLNLWSLEQRNIASSGNTTPLDEPPQSPASSEQSSASITSSGALSSQAASVHFTANGTDGDDRRNSTASSTQGSITSTIELLVGGCLPGDLLPLKISINHTKPIKSMQGIIVTLYRQGRVDTHPAIPLGPSHNGRKQSHDEYYPKSLTGLGGLSLSSAGSSKVFRQDLSQTFTPLIIDPRTLAARITTSIQVPENLFPTIVSVPGAMISFRYYLEVVIDLRGKLAGQERFLPRFGMVNVSSSHGHGDPTINSVDGVMSSPTSGFCSLDTSQIRREKRVVSSVFEVLIGTRDSIRNKKHHRRNGNEHTSDLVRPDQPTGCADTSSGGISTNLRLRIPIDSREEPPSDPQNWSNGLQNSMHDRRFDLSELVPPPVIEEDVDEKTKLKRAEQRLLPSAPPIGNGSTSSVDHYPLPTAPQPFDGFDSARSPGRVGLTAPRYDETLALSSVTAVSTTGFCRYQRDPTQDPDFSTDDSQDDKQEMERLRLQMATSAPDDFKDDGTAGGGTWPHEQVEPTAPTLNDDQPYHYYGPSDSNNTSTPAEREASKENLPLYKR